MKQINWFFSHKIQQQGSILLMAIIMLITMSLLMLKALHHHQDNLLQMLESEQHYWLFFEQAESALAWGKYQPWIINKEKNSSWSCQQPLGANFKSCLRHYKNDYFLLAGHAYFDNKTVFSLYLWLKADKNVMSGFIPLRQGWLDFCLVKRTEFCQ
ncbi:MAG TPA: YgdB family protein [Arsenophonus apicola]|uniref:YgdB family protein n=1 Tax=Arsenophonus TaxID=637 RepID=UPI0015D8EDF7|nr:MULTISPECIES: YgdB family protein [Arsenophonus]UBX29794.1 YgdB family protein [Arsenophonus apicola]